MKQVKKVLALVLVLSMMMGLAAIAGAAFIEYTDAEDIKHPAAVDVLSAVGVINGYTNGSFRPNSPVTRAEMAKILSFAINGGEDVGEQYISACTFKDSLDHWAAGYIGFCVSEGLINGKNPSTFDPNARVTGYEVSKMILCMLGYDAKLNGLTGPNWDTNTHALAIKLDLISELTNYKPASAMTRDNSCQIILNALQTTMVETSGSFTEVDGIEIVGDVTNTDRTASGVGYNGVVDNKLQFVEASFPELVLNSTAYDNFGRPVTSWSYEGNVLGMYQVAPALFSRDMTASGNYIVRRNNGVYPKNLVAFQNGKLISQATYADLGTALGAGSTFAGAFAKVSKMSNDSLLRALGSAGLHGLSNSALALLGQTWNGSEEGMRYVNNSAGAPTSLSTTAVHVEAYYDAVTETAVVDFAPYYFGRVGSIRPEIKDAEGNVVTPAYITINPIKSPGNFAALEVSETQTISGGAVAPVLMENVNVERATLAVGDYIAYYCGYSAEPGRTGYEVDGAVRLTKTTQKVVYSSIGQKDGVVRTYDTQIQDATGSYYTRAGQATTGSNIPLHNPGTTYDIYYATMNGTRVFFHTEVTLGNYVYLENAGVDTSGIDTTYYAKIVRNNGVSELIEVDKDYGPLGANLIGCIATTTQDAQGRTVLSAVGVRSGNSATISVKNSNATVTLDGNNLTADSKTTFVIGTLDAQGKEHYTVYQGVAAVPTLNSGRYYAYVMNEAGTVLDTVFISQAISSGSAEQEGLLVKTGEEPLVTDGKGTYRTVKAIVNGAPTTLNVTTTVYDGLSNGLQLFNAYTLNADELISGLTRVNGTAITSFLPAEAGIITLNGVARTYSDNVLVYTYSVASGELAISSVEAIAALNGTYPSYYTLHMDYTGTPLAGIFAVID